MRQDNFRGGMGFNSGQPVDRFLPNEIRISSKGESRGYVGAVLSLFRDGYEHVIMVGRGQAVPITQEIVEILKGKALLIQVRCNPCFNKQGEIIQEMHVMLSQKETHYDVAPLPQQNYAPTQQFRGNIILVI